MCTASATPTVTRMLGTEPNIKSSFQPASAMKAIVAITAICTTASGPSTPTTERKNSASTTAITAVRDHLEQAVLVLDDPVVGGVQRDVARVVEAQSRVLGPRDDLLDLRRSSTCG